MSESPTGRAMTPRADNRNDYADANTQRASRGYSESNARTRQSSMHDQHTYPAPTLSQQTRADKSTWSTQFNALAWSDDSADPQPPAAYYCEPYEAAPNPRPDVRFRDSVEAPYSDRPPGMPWYRQPAPYLAAVALAAVVLAGGGLAYTLTGTTHGTTPSNPNGVAPVSPQQNQQQLAPIPAPQNGVPQPPPLVENQAPAGIPGGVSAPGGDLPPNVGSARNSISSGGGVSAPNNGSQLAPAPNPAPLAPPAPPPPPIIIWQPPGHGPIGQNPPDGKKNDPAGGSQAPAGANGGAPVGGNQAPAGGNQAPAGGNQAPAGGNQAPAGGNQAPAGGNQAPVGGNQAPAGGNQAPAGGNQAPAGGNGGAPVGGSQTPAGGNQTPAGGNQTPADGNQSPAGGNGGTDPNTNIQAPVIQLPKLPTIPTPF
jgi:hypothetical protein